LEIGYWILTGNFPFLDGINRIYRINELKNSRTQGLKKWNFAVLNMFYHEVQEEQDDVLLWF
jgi:hypothetical protein